MHETIPLSARNCSINRLQWRVVFLLSTVTVALSASEPGPNLPALMPMPATIEAKAGTLPLTRHIRIEQRGFKDVLLDRAADRFVASLTRRTGIDFMRADSLGPGITSIIVDCSAADPAYLTLNAEESYQLDVTGSEVKLTARGPTGVLRGFATIVQLVRAGPAGFSLQAVTIKDRPRFRWRGVMIDISRHFMPEPLIEHEMDVMEAVKLNVLHLHITDSESFSIESKVFTGLHQKGAIDGRYYTQDEVRKLIAYGRDRGIRVVPEFEVPGHLKSWLAAYPELASGPGPFKPESDYVGSDAALNPIDERVYQFLDRLFGEMTGLFPDQYFHIGGDEVRGGQWAKNDDIQKFMRDHSLKDKGEMQAYFTRRVHAIVQKHGKTMMGWDEVLGKGVSQSVAVEAWRSSRMTAKSVKAGHATIVAAPYYIDFLLPAGIHYRNDPLDTNSWSQLDPEEANKLDGPSKDIFVLSGPIPLSPQEQELILGGEVQMWTGTITPEMLDAGLWPRAAAISERFWSPQSVQDVDDMYRRLYVIDRLLGVLGTNQYANQKRMVDRISPQDPIPLQILTSVVEPIKFLSIWHDAPDGKQRELNAIAEVALPESLIARQFCERVHKLLAGASWDEELAQQLVAQMSKWRDNDDRFKRAAAASENLQPLLPLSADLRELARVGIESVSMLEQKLTPSKIWVEAEQRLIHTHQRFADASSGFHGASTLPQPPLEVLIVILPGIVELAQAAEHLVN